MTPNLKFDWRGGAGKLLEFGGYGKGQQVNKTLPGKGANKPKFRALAAQPYDVWACQGRSTQSQHRLPVPAEGDGIKRPRKHPKKESKPSPTYVYRWLIGIRPRRRLK